MSVKNIERELLSLDDNNSYYENSIVFDRIINNKSYNQFIYKHFIRKDISRKEYLLNWFNKERALKYLGDSYPKKCAWVEDFRDRVVKNKTRYNFSS